MRLYLTFLLTCVFLTGSGQAVLDYSRETFANGNIQVNGKWDFYWNKLLTPAEITRTLAQPVQMYVPSSWNQNKLFSNLGTATYRVRILLPEKRQADLSIYFPPVRCAAKFWVNGILKDSIGAVGSPPEYRSQLSGVLLSVPEEPIVDLVVQVANYDYLNGGIAGDVMLGKVSEVQREINIKSGLDTIFAGSLLAMFVYLAIMFMLYRQGYSFFFLASICLCVALHTLVLESGSVLVPQMFPSSEWAIWKKVEFFSVYAIVGLFPLYVSSVFPMAAKKRVDWIFVAIAVLLCTVVILTPHYVYGRLLDVSHLGLLAGFVYAVIVIRKAWLQKNPDAKILLTGVLAAFPFILLEIIKNTSLLDVYIPFNYLVEFGVLTFLLFQVYVLGNHYAMAYQNLEKLVEERTVELSQANRIKDKLLSIISHDIKGPFNTLKGVINLFHQKLITGEEMTPMIKRIENQMSITNLLIENVLLWVRSQMTGISVSMEPMALGELVQEHMILYQTAAAEKRIMLINDVSNEFTVNADRNVLSLALRNLVSNAIKYSFEDGRITISASSTGGLILLSITDEGTGMSETTLEKLSLHDEVLMSERGTGNEVGTGLGLMVSRDYLARMGSDLTIESVAGKGSTFKISLTSVTQN